MIRRNCFLLYVDFLFHQLLSNYFKEKETHEAKRVITEKNVIESFKKILKTEESLTLYKSQVLFFRIQNYVIVARIYVKFVLFPGSNGVERNRRARAKLQVLSVGWKNRNRRGQAAPSVNSSKKGKGILARSHRERHSQWSRRRGLDQACHQT